MQRLHNVEKWFTIAEGGTLNFGNPNPRRVRVDVNAPHESRLFYVDGEGKMTFLASVIGRDVIEFRAYGEFALICEGPEVWIYTIDGEDVSYKNDAAETFTKIWDRRPRNPELELIQYQMHRNQERMFNEMRGEFAALHATNQRLAAAVAAQSASEADGDGADGEPEPDGGADAGGGDPPADGGDKGGAGKKGK